MFDVLVYVYEHYWRGEACPELPLLGRKLSAAGFEADEIEQALSWLAGLHTAAQNAETIRIDAPKTAWETAYVQSPTSMRVYSISEQQQLEKVWIEKRPKRKPCLMHNQNWLSPSVQQ